MLARYANHARAINITCGGLTDSYKVRYQVLKPLSRRCPAKTRMYFQSLQDLPFLPVTITLCNKISSTFCIRLKMWIFVDFIMLNMIDTLSFACKPGKTAKNAIEVSKNTFLTPFLKPLT